MKIRTTEHGSGLTSIYFQQDSEFSGIPTGIRGLAPISLLSTLTLRTMPRKFTISSPEMVVQSDPPKFTFSTHLISCIFIRVSSDTFEEIIVHPSANFQATRHHLKPSCNPKHKATAYSVENIYWRC